MYDEPLATVGSVIGGFTIESEIGLQGMSERYSARSAKGTRHSFGVIPVLHAAFPDRLEEALATVPNHPNVPRFDTVVRVGKMPAVVTEPAFGPTLRQWIDAGGHELHEVLTVFLGICDGVSAGHRIGMAHLDLRPENIVLVSSPHGDVPKVQDFGVARTLFELVAEGKSVTTSGQAIGRPHYWAPERARKPNEAGPASDVFSLGCILYEMLSGVGPFSGLNLYDCFHATVAERYVPLQDRVEGLPDEVLAAVRSALRANPDERLGSCTALIEQIEPLTLGGRTPDTSEANRHGALNHDPVQAMRAAQLVAFGVGATLALAVFSVAAWWWLG